MKRFSERKGHRPVSDVIQTDSMSSELRNSIWNVLDVSLWSSPDFMLDMHDPNIYGFSKVLWFAYLKKPIDERPHTGYDILAVIKEHFFRCPWYEVYDFLEFVVQHYREWHGLPRMLSLLNAVLGRELSGYRIVDGIVTDVTGKEEVEMLQATLEDTKYQGVNTHLRSALQLLSRRDKPDYRNSIKESIFAVESMARIITGDNKATLGEALKVLEKDAALHPALKEGFSKLYGYTSDEEGVRHAMLEEPNLTAADAKYFLMSCTSFINYLKAKM